MWSPPARIPSRTFNVILTCTILYIQIFSFLLISKRSLHSGSLLSGWFGFELQRGQKMFSSQSSTRPVPWTTQPPVQGVSELLSGGKTAAVWRWPPSSADVKNERSFTSTPSLCLYGILRWDVLLHCIQRQSRCTEYMYRVQLSNSQYSYQTPSTATKLPVQLPNSQHSYQTPSTATKLPAQLPNSQYSYQTPSTATKLPAQLPNSQ